METPSAEGRGKRTAGLGALYRVASVLTADAEPAAALATVLDVLIAETGASGGAAYLWDEAVSRLDLAAEKGEPGGWARSFIGMSELLGAAAARPAPAPLVLPLTSRSRALGALIVEGAPAADRDGELATIASLIAGVAADTWRVMRQSDEYGRLLMSIEKATMWLSSYLEREPILGEAIGFARSIFRATHVSIVEIDADGMNARVIRTAQPKRGDVTGTTFKVGEGWCGRVLATGKPLLSPDPETGKPPPGYERARRFRTDSFVIAPIFSSVSDGAEVRGAINVADRIGGMNFSDRDLELLCVLARAVGVALTNAQLYERATVDSLTRVYTKQHFLFVLEEAVRKARAARRPLSFAIADLDDFKKVNDTYGHPTGDVVLKEVGAAMKAALRSGDTAGRYGGEEFVVIMPGATLQEGRTVSNGILERIRGLEVDAEGRKLRVTASMGVAEMRSGDTVESLIARADAAQYRAKYGGKNRLESADK